MGAPAALIENPDQHTGRMDNVRRVRATLALDAPVEGYV
jgi:hypothetical protein